jgi:hypothetical protein
MIDALSWRASSELVRSSAMRRRGGRPAFTRRRASRGGRSYACLARKPCTPARCTATSAQGKEPPTRGRTPPRSLLESDTMDRGMRPRRVDRSTRSGELVRERRASGAPTTDPPSPRLRAEAGARRDHGRPPMVDGVDDFAGVDSLQVDRRDPEVGMLDMRVIWQRRRASRGPRRGRVSPLGYGYAVGA